MHAILFIAELPRSVNDFASKFQDQVDGEHFKKRFCDFVDNIVHCDIPRGVSEGETPSFPACLCEDVLLPKEVVDILAFKHQPH